MTNIYKSLDQRARSQLEYLVAHLTYIHTDGHCSLMMLREECNLPLSQMNDVRICALVSKEHPESLDIDINDLTNGRYSSAYS